MRSPPLLPAAITPVVQVSHWWQGKDRAHGGAQVIGLIKSNILQDSFGHQLRHTGRLHLPSPLADVQAANQIQSPPTILSTCCILHCRWSVNIQILCLAFPPMLFVAQVQIPEEKMYTTLTLSCTPFTLTENITFFLHTQPRSPLCVLCSSVVGVNIKIFCSQSLCFPTTHRSSTLPVPHKAFHSPCCRCYLVSAT